jgi:thiol-disulfide isomerase/thioredoxin
MTASLLHGHVLLAQTSTPSSPGAIESATPSEPAPEESKPLGVGDAPPQLKVAAWMKGTGIEKFEPGNIYIVDFWATWCKPCIAGMPHLTALQERFKDQHVKVLGVSIWEDAMPPEEGKSIQDRVRAFVEKQGSRVGYDVAYAGDVTDPTQSLAWAWMNASRRNSIPTVFVIGKDAKIAWIGHPSMGLDEVIAGLVAGTFDAKKEAEVVAAREGRRTQGMMLATSMQQKLDDEDFAGAAEIADEILKIDPVMFAPTSIAKFRMLLTGLRDADQAYAYAREATQGAYKENPNVQLGIARTILDSDERTRKDADLAMALAKRATELFTNGVPQAWSTLADAQSLAGKPGDAVASIDKAIELADEGSLQQLREKRAKFEAAIQPENPK